MNVQHTFLNYCLGPHGVTVNTLYYGTHWEFCPHSRVFIKVIFLVPFSALVLHKLVLSIADDKECSSLLSQCWYIDDGVLAGHSQSVLLQQQGPSLGLHINLKKCELFGTGDLSQFPISIPSSSIPKFELLGAPIGDFNFCSAFTMGRISNASTLLSHLQNVGSIDPHVAFTLRSCAGFCKFAYVARTTPQSMATATFEHFDRLIHECFSECTGVNTTNNPGFKLN